MISSTMQCRSLYAFHSCTTHTHRPFFFDQGLVISPRRFFFFFSSNNAPIPTSYYWTVNLLTVVMIYQYMKFPSWTRFFVWIELSMEEEQQQQQYRAFGSYLNRNMCHSSRETHQSKWSSNVYRKYSVPTRYHLENWDWAFSVKRYLNSLSMNREERGREIQWITY